MNKPVLNLRPDRHPSESYEDILARDTRPIPDHLREKTVLELGTDPIAASRYYDPAFFQREIDCVWGRVWQMACREEDIPSPGDYHIYEIVGKSLIVTRTPSGAIKAFFNSCVHRGRKLVTLDGSKQEFRCPYHGFSWRCDGTFKDNPIAWDFPQWKDRDMRLPEVRVATWGGFVFVNFDPNAPALETVIGPLAEHFAPYDFANRYKAVHVAKVIRANWKATAEAFMESHHSLATHPQILPYLADVNSQYDCLSDYVTRHFSASGVASPLVSDMNYSETDIMREMARQNSGTRRRVGDNQTVEVPQGMTARAFAAEQARKALSAEDGWDYSKISDAEMLDALLYNVWPHMSFWAGYAPNLVYRWRPNGRDPESAIMDVMILKRVPKSGPRPKPVPVHRLGDDEPWSAATELGSLAAIFEQDMGNLPYVQEGLRASGTGLVHFGRYSEMRIRQLHRMLDRYMAI
ncbi:MAG TPA: aromatic ring-hydroxylating dioxygenase subunit alpha [Rhizomicrobium sp.]|nr:aromatic ring-hydroxylating dioxygenase subunit alpha [Rhizomicrobium sp.]